MFWLPLEDITMSETNKLLSHSFPQAIRLKAWNEVKQQTSDSSGDRKTEPGLLIVKTGQNIWDDYLQSKKNKQQKTDHWVIAVGWWESGGESHCHPGFLPDKNLPNTENWSQQSTGDTTELKRQSSEQQPGVYRVGLCKVSSLQRFGEAEIYLMASSKSLINVGLRRQEGKGFTTERLLTKLRTKEQGWKKSNSTERH